MSIFLDVIGSLLLIFGFWVLLSSFDRTGPERIYRIRVAVGSMLVGLGNIILLQIQGLGFLLIAFGALIALTSRRPVS